MMSTSFFFTFSPLRCCHIQRCSPTPDVFLFIIISFSAEQKTRKGQEETSSWRPRSGVFLAPACSKKKQGNQRFNSSGSDGNPTVSVGKSRRLLNGCRLRSLERAHAGSTVFMTAGVAFDDVGNGGEVERKVRKKWEDPSSLLFLSLRWSHQATEACSVSTSRLIAFLL